MCISTLSPRYLHAISRPAREHLEEEHTVRPPVARARPALAQQDLGCRGVDSANHRVGARAVVAGGCGCGCGYGCGCGSRIVVVVVGAGIGSGGGTGRDEPLGDVEVSKAHVTGLVDEDVVRLEVAVQHGVLVQVRHLAQGEADGWVLGGECWVVSAGW